VNVRTIAARMRARNLEAKVMAKKVACCTIFSDEFRVELQPLKDGPLLVVSGHAHDKELTLIVRGVEPADESDSRQEVACIYVTAEQLAEVVARVRTAQKK
jgi:hypothetical protein